MAAAMSSSAIATTHLGSRPFSQLTTLNSRLLLMETGSCSKAESGCPNWTSTIIGTGTTTLASVASSRLILSVCRLKEPSSARDRKRSFHPAALLRSSLLTQAASHSAGDQLARIRDGFNSPVCEFTSDASGNIIKRQDTRGGVNDSMNIPSSYYDALNRPVMWENTG